MTRENMGFAAKLMPFRPSIGSKRGFLRIWVGRLAARHDPVPAIKIGDHPRAVKSGCAK